MVNLPDTPITGAVIGIVLSVPLWALIILAVRWAW
jgi:hypothetical protein